MISLDWVAIVGLILVVAWFAWQVYKPPPKAPAPNPVVVRRAHFIQYVKGELALMNAWEEAFDPEIAETINQKYAYKQQINEEVFRRWMKTADEEAAMQARSHKANPMMTWREYAQEQPPQYDA